MLLMLPETLLVMYSDRFHLRYREKIEKLSENGWTNNSNKIKSLKLLLFPSSIHSLFFFFFGPGHPLLDFEINLGLFSVYFCVAKIRITSINNFAALFIRVWNFHFNVYHVVPYFQYIFSFSPLGINYNTS